MAAALALAAAPLWLSGCYDDVGDAMDEAFEDKTTTGLGPTAPAELSSTSGTITTTWTSTTTRTYYDYYDCYYDCDDNTTTPEPSNEGDVNVGPITGPGQEEATSPPSPTPSDVDYGCLECGRTTESDAQFLIRGTFGPTRRSLQELGETTLQAWVKAQQALPPGSHREYYRKRVNSRLAASSRVGGARSPCAAGSRWHAFLLSAADKGKQLSVRDNQVYVGGVHRSDIDPAHSGNGIPAPSSCANVLPNWAANKGKSCSDIASPVGARCASADPDSDWITMKLCQQSCFDARHAYPGDDCSAGWPSLQFEGFVCDVEEEVGGFITLGREVPSSRGKGEASAAELALAAACQAPEVYKNPAIWFSSWSADSAAAPSFQELRPGVVLLSEAVGQDPCELGPFVRHGGQYFVLDPRVELIQNDLASPSGAEGSRTCRAVPRSFVNEGSCQLRTACGEASQAGVPPLATLTLNTSTLQLFYDAADRYVYAVRGLAPDKSPCGRRSRWKLLDCGTEDCTTSSMSTADASAVASALAAEQGTLRDIYARCDGVVAGAVAASGSDRFRHLHPHEYNVYDFTAWVGAHPGDAQWATGSFEIQFPSGHTLDQWKSMQSSLEYLGRQGDAVDFAALPAGLQTAWGVVAYESCGSPGEVANDPSLGHEFSFNLEFKVVPADIDFEVPYYTPVYDWLSKTTVWTMMAIGAEDQLRQRAAWALSQIMVASVNGVSGSPKLSEAWTSFYDIFVRHAFGNYRDVLREVTYNPIMGEYLSFRNSRSFDADGKYPDENYARESMQLFTIGLWELNPDGSRKTDASGNYVSTYDNEHITSFARVFTGFTENPPRPNIEDNGVWNRIDPMRMHGSKHDVYPKPDLNGNFLGDGYPLCSDLPTQSFLHQGARYRFIGYDYAGADALVLGAGSALRSALAQLRLRAELGSTLDCTGAECGAVGVRVVKVGDGYYEYVRPTCVHLYFFNGQTVTPGLAQDFGKDWKNECVDPSVAAAGTACCKGCTNEASNGMINNGRTCRNVAQTWPYLVNTGCPNMPESFASKKYCQLACWTLGMAYPGDNCSDGLFQAERVCRYQQEKVSFSAASARCESLGMHVCEQKTPTGACGHDDINVWTPATCEVRVEVLDDGKVVSQWDDKTKKNPFAVPWADGSFPALGSCPGQCTEGSSGCICPISVELRAVFDTVPSRAALKAQLRIGAFPPSSGASFVCAQQPCGAYPEVKAYTAGAIDANTVFECDGSYFRNVESVVHVAGHRFRNPPAFALAKEMTGREVLPEEALAEVEALLDHLFHHPNVPPFVAYRLIQRLVTSNPTPAYVSAVAQAFSTGRVGNETYSGQYGDLGATFASILLHPEARSSSASTGKLREPLIKIMHFMRSMEYGDSKGREFVIKRQDQAIGQWPYYSPEVFNFYGVEYQPASFAGAPEGLVAPEFEIFTPPMALAWLNGMLSLADYGLSACKDGFGQNIRSCSKPEGGLSYAPANARDMSEVYLLLTGGRFRDDSATLAAAVEASGDGDKLKAAMRAVIMSPEFHVLGDPGPAGPREPVRDELPPEPQSYKAMVMLYLSGGADTFNMLVPTCTTLYQEYLDMRQDVSLSKGQLLEISASNSQTCGTFGVHHRLPFVRDLYEQGQLAFVSNIGSLVQPTTKAQWKDKTGNICAGLFSHKDQQAGGQTLKCQVTGASPRGFGGRLADALAAEDYTTTSFSLAGASTWSQGVSTNVEIIDGRRGLVRLEGYQELQAVVGNATGGAYGNVYCEEYSKQLAAAVHASERLGTVLETVELQTSFDEESPLGQKLRQVARLMATREQRRAERDFFYVDLAGFDTHDWVNEVLDEKFSELNAALESFVTELKIQGTWDSTVLVTSSDFGRTLTSNGKGTDHAWAGNHFVLGGSVQGGRIFNRFPESLLDGNSQDAGRGRLIPMYPWESVMVPIAEWMGGTSSSWSDVFPNLGHFNATEHIIGMGSLFASYNLV